MRRSVAIAWAFLVCLSFVPAEVEASFAPALGVTSTSYDAGATPTITARVDTDDDFYAQRMKSIELTLPRGLFPVAGSGTYCDLHSVGGEYECGNEEALVGVASFDLTIDTDLDPEAVSPLGLGEISAPTYLEKPQGGELARLVSIPDALPTSALYSTLSLSEGDEGVVLEVSDLPTASELYGVEYDSRISDIELTLNGTGESGQALLRNPTFCDPENGFKATITTYGDDGIASDDDVTVFDSAAYPVSGCEGLSFAPSMDFGLSNLNAGEPTSPSVSVALPAGHASMSALTLSLPSAFMFNPDVGVTSCSADQAAALACPATAAIGTVRLASPLVQAELVGTTYLGTPAGDRLTTVTILPEPVAVTIDGYIWQRSDLGLDVGFELPPVPLDSLSFTSDGAAGALLLNPFDCGDYIAAAAAESSTGKSAAFDFPFSVASCNTARGDTFAFSAKVQTRRPAHFTSLRLRVSRAPGRALEKLRFTLPRGFRVRSRRRLDRAARLAYIDLRGEDRGHYRATLRPRASAIGAKVRLIASNRQLKHARVVLSNRGGRGRIVVSGLPDDEVTDLTLTVFGRGERLLRTPPQHHDGCTAPLKFAAAITGPGGKRTDLAYRSSRLCSRKARRRTG